MISIAVAALIVCIVLLTLVYAWKARRQQAGDMTDTITAYMAFTDKPVNPKDIIASADGALKIMTARNLVDYRLYKYKGDAFAEQGDFKKAEENYRAALTAMSDPRQIKSTTLFDEEEMNRSRNYSQMAILKKLEWIKNGKKWKSGKEINDALREDLRKRSQKQ